jgi:hypothetical protein
MDGTDDTQRALLEAVATRRLNRRTPRDVRQERFLAAFAVAMTALALYGTVRAIAALV